MKNITYYTKGTCSVMIEVTLDDDDNIVDVKFTGGCNGNLKGICALVKGRKAAEIKKTLSGIECRDKGTSCPDQLAKALDKLGV